MSYSQNVTKLTEYDYLMGTASNTWYYKLNASIDSLNKFIDTLQVHRAMLYENLFMYNDSASLALVADAMYARSGGSPVDTNRLLPKYGDTKTATGRMVFSDTLRANGIDAPCDTCSQQTFVVMPHGTNDGKFVFTDKRTVGNGYFTIRINRSAAAMADLFLQGINGGNFYLRSAWSRIDFSTGPKTATIRNTLGSGLYGGLALGTGSADHITLKNGGDIGFHTDTPSPYGVKFARSVFIDTTLTANNVTVPSGGSITAGAGTVVTVDSLISAYLSFDSTGTGMYHINDSSNVNVFIFYHEKPISTNDGSMKFGTVKMKFGIVKTSDDPKYFTVRTDSTNNVVLGCVDFIVDGYYSDYGGQSRCRGCNYGIGEFTGGVGAYEINSCAPLVTKAWYKDAEATLCGYSLYTKPWKIIKGNGWDKAVITATFTYRMPPGNTSLRPVWIDDL